MSAATEEVTDADPFGDLGESTAPLGEQTVEIPNFAKMPKKEIIAWVHENVMAEEIEDGFDDLTVKEMRAKLKAALTPESDPTSPANTGFDVNDLIHQTVKEIEAFPNEEAATVAILGLQDDSEFNFFKIGGILSRFKAEGWTGVFDSFGDFVESEFDFKQSKAEILVRVFQQLVSCGAPWSAAKEVGWSKLGVIAKHLTPDNWAGWFDAVKGVSHAAVVQMSKDANKKQAKGDDDGKVPESTPTTKLSIVVHDDQKETIKAALAQAKEAFGTEYDGPALEGIALNYLANPVPMDAPADVVEAAAKATKPEEAEDDQEAEDVLRTIFLAVREQLDMEEGIKTIYDALTEVYPELNIEISLGDGDAPNE